MKTIKFDAVVGNPPYQLSGDSDRSYRLTTLLLLFLQGGFLVDKRIFWLNSDIICSPMVESVRCLFFLIREPILANILKRLWRATPEPLARLFRAIHRLEFQLIPKVARKIPLTCMMRRTMNIIRDYFIFKIPNEK